MSFAHSPKIVTDGLVLSLDAGNTKSYPGSGTAWFDKSGYTNNGTLTNGPTFNTGSVGSIVFDGVDDYVNQTLNTGSFTTEATLIMFLKLTNATPSNPSETGIERLSANTGKEASHYPWIDGSAYLGTFQTGTTRVNSITLSTTINRTNWHMITIASSPGANNWKFYQNTSLIHSANGSNTVFFSQDGAYNLVRSQTFLNGPFYYINGNIAIVHLYNRSLSAQEISQNYNALKGRFGLS
jgi:hypothetical protein